MLLAVIVVADDLARVADAIGKGAIRGRRIFERGVAAAAVKEAVPMGATAGVYPDNLPSVVDAGCLAGEAAPTVVNGRNE